MLTFKVQTNLSEALAAAIGKAATRAEHIVAVQAAKDTSPYVPFLTGSLDERTRVSGNTIIYPGPYARYLYYGKVMVNPETGSHLRAEGRNKGADRQKSCVHQIFSQSGAVPLVRSVQSTEP